jgi:hypothetical protein
MLGPSDSYSDHVYYLLALSRMKLIMSKRAPGKFQPEQVDGITRHDSIS